MAGDKKTDNSFKGGDPRTIDVDSPSERAFWCKVLGIGEEELIAAVAVAGWHAQAVKDHLARKRS